MAFEWQKHFMCFYYIKVSKVACAYFIIIFIESYLYFYLKYDKHEYIFLFIGETINFTTTSFMNYFRKLLNFERETFQKKTYFPLLKDQF